MKYIWLYVVAIVASLGGLLSGYDTGVISGALLFINETWILPDTLQGFLVSSVLIGAVIGAATNGILADISELNISYEDMIAVCERLKKEVEKMTNKEE